MVPPRRRNPLRIGLFAACAATGLTPAGLNAQPSPPRPAATTGKLDRYGDPLPPGAVVRLGTVKYRQDSPIYRIAYAPDGKHFVTDGDDGILRVWDATDGRLIRRIDPQVGVMQDFQLTSRGTRALAMGSSFEPGVGFAAHVAMIELETGGVADQATWKDDILKIGTFALHPDRQLVAFARPAEGIRVVDAWTEAELCRFDTDQRQVDRIVFARDGKRLAVETHGDNVTGRDRDVRIYDLAQKKETRVIKEPGFRFDDLVFSPDGSTVAATTKQELILWGVETGERIPFRQARVGPVSYSPDGRMLAGIGVTKRLGLFDLTARRIAYIFETRTPYPSKMALSPDGRILVANGGPMVLHSWEIRANRDRFAMPESHADSVNSVLIAPDGETIISAGEDGSIRLWDPRDGRHLRRWDTPGILQPPILAPDGTLLVASPGLLERIDLLTWDFAHGREPVGRSILPELEGEGRPCASGLADDGQTFLLLTRKGRIHGWDRVNNKPRDVSQPELSVRNAPEGFKNIPLYVGGAVFLAGGKKLAAVLHLGGLQMIDMATGNGLFASDTSEPGQRIVASPDERILAITQSILGPSRLTGRPIVDQMPQLVGQLGSESGTIKLVDAATGKETHRIAVEGSEFWAMAFAPDGKTLAATSGWETGRIHFIDVATGKETRAIEGPPFRSPALAYTPDGRRLVSGMADGTILVWDARAAR